MFHDARQAYEQGKKTTDSSRQLEAGALFKTARMLEDCMRDWDAPDRPDRLRNALRHNQRLWTFFQTEITRPDHGLPVDLRRDLLRVSAFIDRRTMEILAKPSREKLGALVEINRQIGSGLAETPSGAPVAGGGPAREG